MPLGVELICRTLAKGAKRGLFHGVPIRHGFKVSKKGKNKTKRTWKPNIQRVLLYSEALDKRIRLTVTTTALRHSISGPHTHGCPTDRAIDYHGGLDNYLFQIPERLRKSEVANDLRAQILKAQNAKMPKAKSQSAEKPKASNQEANVPTEQKKSVVERFYIEKVLKSDGRVALEMVSNLTGQRLDKRTKQEVVPDPDGHKIKTIPQPNPVFIEELRRKYGIE